MAAALLGGMVFWLISVQKDKEWIFSNIEARISEIIGETESSAEEILANIDKRSLSLNSDTPIPFFVLRNGETISWTTNDFVPDPGFLAKTGEIHYVRNYAGIFLSESWEIDSSTVLVAAVPLLREYRITNPYLQPTFNHAIFDDTSVSLFEKNSDEGKPILFKSSPLFRMQVLKVESGTDFRWVAFVFFLFFIAGFISFLIRIVKRLRIQTDLKFLIIVCTLIAVRVIMLGSKFPVILIKTPLFDFQNFASSEINPGLGDLLVNSVFLLILTIEFFFGYSRFHSFKYLLRNRVIKFLFQIVCVICCFFGLLFPFIVIQTISNNSTTISLSVTNLLEWNSIDIFAYLVIVSAGISAFLFSHVFMRLAFFKNKYPRLLVIFGIGLLVFCLINELTQQEYLPALIVGIIWIFIAAITKMYRAFAQVNYAMFAYLIWTILLFSIGIGEGVRHFKLKEQQNAQFKFAETFLVDLDDLGEYLLNESRDRIERDAFIRSRFNSPFFGKESIRQKIRQVFLPAYLDRYTPSIFLFNASGDPMENPTEARFSDLLRVYDLEASKTAYSGVYSVPSAAPSMAKKYVVICKVLRGDVILGYVVMEFALKKHIPESVYPELLVDSRFQKVPGSQEFSYAIFSGRKIDMSYGNYDYENFFKRNVSTDPELFLKGMVSNQYYHAALRESDGRIVVVSRKADPLMVRLSDFCLPFVIGLIFLLLFLLLMGASTFFSPRRLFLAARIQLLLNLAFLIPLILVSVIMLTLVSASFTERMDGEYLERSRNFADQVALLYGNTDEDSQSDAQLTEWSRLANVDVNLYKPNGQFRATSQPLIIDNMIASGNMNPLALKRITNGENNFVAVEQAGNLEYYVSYATLRSPESGTLQGSLGIPFFQSGYLLKKMQTSVLANILVIFSLVFVVFFLISIFVSRWLTFPFRLIASSLGRTSLTQNNQPIKWSSDDEIGMMIKEYNEMLVNLQESKTELERSQREKVWREIAQQVAHEIKNPLTPIKLKLQQLIRSTGSKNADIGKTVESILAQVETLNEIASSFSSFAKMPEPKMDRVEIVDLLRRTVNLHNASGEIALNVESSSVYVIGDGQLLGRIFSNLLLNSFQARKSESEFKVTVSLSVEGPICRIIFNDTGKGMSRELQEKIFVPHFSTRHSGSGLGLAISRQGIEQMGGTITFESMEGSGTTFYIELPVA